MESKDSEYYMGNEDQLPLVILFKNSYKNISYELPWDATIEDVLDAVYGALVGLTYVPSGVLEAMKQYVEDHTLAVDEGNYEEKE